VEALGDCGAVHRFGETVDVFRRDAGGLKLRLKMLGMRSIDGE
jgi:hypothetical protein